MIDKLITFDKKLFVFLNGLGSETYDFLWLKITKQVYWIPFFIFILYLLIKKITWKQLLLIVVLLAILIACTDQTANLFKNGFQRLRPCNDLEIKSIIRIVQQSDTYSFFSAHAANSMATMTFLFFVLRKYYNNLYWLFLFPVVFAYSRIYLGLHFPLDILAGYICGFLYGFLFYNFYKKLI